jgi:hypothetical protein
MKLLKKYRWLITNIAIAILLPIIYMIWIRNEVQYEYEMGYRTSTSGDTITIPIVAFTLILWLLLVLINVGIIVIKYLRRLTSRSS